MSTLFADIFFYYRKDIIWCFSLLSFYCIAEFSYGGCYHWAQRCTLKAGAQIHANHPLSWDAVPCAQRGCTQRGEEEPPAPQTADVLHHLQTFLCMYKLYKGPCFWQGSWLHRQGLVGIPFAHGRDSHGMLKVWTGREMAIIHERVQCSSLPLCTVHAYNVCCRIIFQWSNFKALCIHSLPLCNALLKLAQSNVQIHCKH